MSAVMDERRRFKHTYLGRLLRVANTGRGGLKAAWLMHREHRLWRKEMRLLGRRERDAVEIRRLHVRIKDLNARCLEI